MPALEINIETILRFLSIYLLLIIVLFILSRFGIKQSKNIIIISIKMTLQLIIAGLCLEYIFRANNPIFTFLYFIVMISFTIYRVLSKNKWLNKKFKMVTALSIFFSTTIIISFFIIVVANQKIWNPQYVITIGGMVLGNAMTASTLALKTIHDNLNGKRVKINALLCSGASVERILMPFVGQAIETAILPTLNSMLGMGIVHLPGMMTGSILAGAVPFTAILYQITIMITICIANLLCCFLILFLGHKTLYDKKNQTINFNLI